MQPLTVYWPLSDEPGATSEPLTRLIRQGKGCWLLLHLRMSAWQHLKPSKKASSSSSSRGSEADDECTSNSSQSGPPSSDLPPLLPPAGRSDDHHRVDPTLDQPMKQSLHLASPSEDSDVPSDSSLVEDMGEELEIARQGLVQDLFDLIQEADNAPLALRVRRAKGVEALDPILQTRFEHHENRGQDFQELCQQLLPMFW
ncbi:unnamed protein product [Sympodiomycopsis kandeliae]